MRHRLFFMLVSCGFAVAFNFAYDLAITFRIVTSMALLFRVLAPIEACWRCIGRRYDCKMALGVLLVVLVTRIFSPDFISMGYLNTRSMVTVSVAIVCLMFSICSRCNMFESDNFYAKHLTIQTCWMVVHSIFSLVAPCYTSSWSKRSLFRWAYVACVVVITLLYQRILTNQPAHQED